MYTTAAWHGRARLTAGAIGPRRKEPGVCDNGGSINGGAQGRSEAEMAEKRKAQVTQPYGEMRQKERV